MRTSATAHLRRDDAGHRRAVRLPGVRLQAQKPAPPPLLPPLVQTCPMHPDIVETKPGTCPLCKMNLVAGAAGRGLDVPAARGGDRDRARARAGCARARWCRSPCRWRGRAAARSTSQHLEPGLCADGSPRITKRTLRPHGNHNPQHGGQFFMAPDNWHHLEGTYPRAGSFRLFVYDDYARALNPAALGQISGRLVGRRALRPGDEEDDGAAGRSRCACRRTAPISRPIPATAPGRRGSPRR